jgi:hypothetical protein
MKRAKKPTRTQKMIISHYHLKPDNWLVKESDYEKLTLIHRYTGTERTVNVIDVSEYSRKDKR